MPAFVMDRGVIASNMHRIVYASQCTAPRPALAGQLVTFSVLVVSYLAATGRIETAFSYCWLPMQDTD
jgi:hypothetical protein